MCFQQKAGSYHCEWNTCHSAFYQASGPFPSPSLKGLPCYQWQPEVNLLTCLPSIPWPFADIHWSFWKSCFVLWTSTPHFLFTVGKYSSALCYFLLGCKVKWTHPPSTVLQHTSNLFVDPVISKQTKNAHLPGLVSFASGNPSLSKKKIQNFSYLCIPSLLLSWGTGPHVSYVLFSDLHLCTCFYLPSPVGVLENSLCIVPPLCHRQSWYLLCSSNATCHVLTGLCSCLPWIHPHIEPTQNLRVSEVKGKINSSKDGLVRTHNVSLILLHGCEWYLDVKWKASLCDSMGWEQVLIKHIKASIWTNKRSWWSRFKTCIRDFISCGS